MYNDKNIIESGVIGFEDSLISGTKIDIPANKKRSLNNKRQKIEQIEKKYEKPKNSEKLKMNRGYSYNEPQRSGGKLAKGSTTKGNKKGDRLRQESHDPEVKASKITAHKRNVFQNKKKSEITPNQRASYKSRKNMDEEIDEKLNTQTFRFTNQFKSDLDIDGDYMLEDDDNYDDEIAEEIDSRSNDSPRGNSKNMKLRKNTGPVEIPSDTNPFKKRAHKGEESVEGIGTPNSRPPKAPNPKGSTKLALESPAHQIFTTKRQKKQLEEEKGIFVEL